MPRKCFLVVVSFTSVSRNSSDGRALDWRSKGPCFGKGKLSCLCWSAANCTALHSCGRLLQLAGFTIWTKKHNDKGNFLACMQSSHRGCNFGNLGPALPKQVHRLAAFTSNWASLKIAEHSMFSMYIVYIAQPSVANLVILRTLSVW